MFFFKVRASFVQWPCFILTTKFVFFLRKKIEKGFHIFQKCTATKNISKTKRGMKILRKSLNYGYVIYGYPPLHTPIGESNFFTIKNRSPKWSFSGLTESICTEISI